MPTNNFSGIKFKPNAPENIKEELKKISQDLTKVPEKYKDVLKPSVKKKIEKLFSLKEKKKLEEKRKELEKELKKAKEEVARIFSTYYEDRDIRLLGNACINTIDMYCKKAGIKKIPTHSHASLAAEIKSSLKDIRAFLEKTEEDATKLKDIVDSMNKEEEVNQKLAAMDENFKSFKQNVTHIKAQGVDTEQYDKLIEKFEKIKSENKNAKKSQINQQAGESLQEKEECDSRFAQLIKKLDDSSQDWEKTDADLKAFSKDIEKLEKKLKEIIKMSKEPIFKPDEELDKIELELNAYNKEIDKKIEFVEKLKNYYVFDWNMGVKELNDSLKSLPELKELVGKNADNVKYESQPCLPIAKGEKKLEPQYDHSADWTAGSYYILVDKNQKQVEDAYTNTSWGNTRTINKSNQEQPALREVEEYLKKALRAGTFEGIKI